MNTDVTSTPSSYQITTRGAVIIFATSLAAVGLVFVAAVLSIFIVFSFKAVFAFITKVVHVIGEIIVALVAAVTSGATITLTVIVAAGTSAMAIPASSIEARIGLSVAVSGAAIVVTAAAVIFFASLNVDMEVAAAVIGSAAMSVAFAAAWAVGVMSLIEKETQQVGLKMTSILDAVRHNNHRILRILVKLHAGLKQRDLDVALLHAVKAGFPECVEILLATGAKPDARDSYENPTLVLAGEAGSYRILRILLDVGCSVDIRNGARATALHQAARYGHEECVELLLQRGANVNVQDSQWRTPLMHATGNVHKSDKMVAMIIEAGCDVNIVGPEELTALHFAAMRGMDINILLRAGAHAHAIDSDWNTALHLAAKEGFHNVVSRLLEVGCDPTHTNKQLKSPLHLAALRGHLQCIKLLVDAGSDPNTPDLSGHLPVWYAASGGSAPSVKYFIQRNCLLLPYDVDGKVNHALNPLRIALEKRHLLVARILTFAGCAQRPLLDWLEEVPPDCWTDYTIGHVTWLREYTSNPQNLLHLCRLRIRKCIGTELPNKEMYLPLPRSMRQIICLDDLDDREWEGDTYVEAFLTYQETLFQKS